MRRSWGDLPAEGSGTAEDLWTGATTAVRGNRISLRMDEDAFAILRLRPR